MAGAEEEAGEFWAGENGNLTAAEMGLVGCGEENYPPMGRT